MPRTDGLRTFLRTTVLTKDDWLALLECRRLMLKPHLDAVWLTKLGDVECLRSETSFDHRIIQDNPVIAEVSGGGLELQGIFGIQPAQQITRFKGTGYQPYLNSGYIPAPNGAMLLWGLLRTAVWVVVQIIFQGEAGYKDRGYERATEVLVTPVSVEGLLEWTGVQACDVWDALGGFVTELRERRRNNLRVAEDLARTVETENELLRLLQNR